MPQTIVPLNTAVGVAEVLQKLAYLDQLKETKAAIEAEEERIREELLEQCLEWQRYWPDSRFELPTGVRLTVTANQPRGTVKRDLLLAAGVAPDVIQAATVWGEPGKVHVRMDRTRASEEQPE